MKPTSVRRSRNPHFFRLSSIAGLGILLALLFGLGEAAQAQTALTQARVDRIRNQVEVTLGGTTRPAKPKEDILSPQDQIRTGPKSLAQLIFNDKSLIRLGQNSVFRFEGTQRQFVLNQGVGIMITPPKSGNTTFMRTPTAVAAVQGSLVLGIVRPKDPTQADSSDDAIFFSFSSPITVESPNGEYLGKVEIGKAGIVRNGQWLGSTEFDLLGALSRMPMLQGLDPSNPADGSVESVEAQEILAAEEGVLQEVVSDLIPIGDTLSPGDSSSPSVTDIIKDPVEANPDTRDLTIIIQ